MTELQIGLLAIGTLVVGGVLLYNRMQERSARRSAEKAFGSGHADVLLEPVAVAPVPPAKPAPRASIAAASASAEPDARLDYIIEINLADANAVAGMQEQWRAIERRHAHRAILAGAADGMRWRAARQLVSRDGPVSEAELIEFRSAVETLAASIGATVSAPEMRAAVEAARELDAFCSEADIQVVLHVEGGPFPGTRIRASAEAAGLALEVDGRYALRDDEGRLLYTLGTRDGTPFTIADIQESTPAALSLAMDLASAPDTAHAFESMARLAHQLASVLGGGIVDDNGRALDDRALGAIAQQLSAARARLVERGLAPGSPAAQRLFS